MSTKEFHVIKRVVAGQNTFAIKLFDLIEDAEKVGYKMLNTSRISITCSKDVLVHAPEPHEMPMFTIVPESGSDVWTNINAEGHVNYVFLAGNSNKTLVVEKAYVELGDHDVIMSSRNNKISWKTSKKDPKTCIFERDSPFLPWLREIKGLAVDDDGARTVAVHKDRIADEKEKFMGYVNRCKKVHHEGEVLFLVNYTGTRPLDVRVSFTMNVSEDSQTISTMDEELDEEFMSAAVEHVKLGDEIISREDRAGGLAAMDHSVAFSDDEE